MILNIYYSSRFQQIKEFQDFFINNYLFNNKSDYLAGQLLDVYLYDIKKYINHQNFTVILVDDFLIDEIYDNEIEIELLNKWKNDKDIIFVALSKNFHQLKLAQEINFVRAFDKKDIFEFLLTEITHDLLRILLGKEKINIFISHAKQDGREIAKAIKNFIDNDVKLGNFFDEIDIQNSSKWDEVLEEKVENSLFLYILSDIYANTLWTKKELIIAKKNNIPMIGIDVIQNQNSSVSPFIANTKLYKLVNDIENIEVNCNDGYILHTHSNIRKIINYLLMEALKFYISKQSHDDILIRQPDLVDICNAKNDILYPEPPLMNIEKEILEQCGKHKIFTPLIKNLKNINKNIAISISESQTLEEKGLTNDSLQLCMIEIARYLIVQGNTLIYGGDLGYKREFNFTTILSDTFRAYNNKFEKNQKLINYAVYPFCNFIDIEVKNQNRDVIEFKDYVGQDCNINDLDIITENLTKMREIINANLDIKIAIGGKVTGFSGFYPGVLEEVYLALKDKKKIILVSSFGGIVEKITDLLKGQDVEELTFEYQLKNNINLNNFLKEHSEYYEIVKNKYDEIFNLIKRNKYNNIFIINSLSIKEIINNILKEIK